MRVATETQYRILSLAFALAARDPKSPFTNGERAWWCTRLAVVDAAGTPLPFTAEELRPWRTPLMTYVSEHRPRIAGAVLTALLEVI